MENKLRVSVVFGTRPEAVKMAPVIKALKERPEHFEVQVCVTAQHREMLDQVLQVFEITPDVDLDLMLPDQQLPQLTARIFTGLDPVLTAYRPDWLLIQGDTTTVMAAAILGFYRQIKIGHVEAGLRTHDKWQPFPEEINRRIAGVVADLHFAPTQYNRQNLLREGVPDEIIVVTGNPAIDALHQITRQPAPPAADELLKDAGILGGTRRLVLVTAHRRENFGQPIRDICTALKQLAHAYRDEITIVYPVHLNPNTLVLRERTERQEGITAGTLKLVGTDPEVIFIEAQQLLDDPAAHAAMAGAVNPYGDGHAAERIVAALLAAKKA